MADISRKFKKTKNGSFLFNQAFLILNTFGSKKAKQEKPDELLQGPYKKVRFNLQSILYLLSKVAIWQKHFKGMLRRFESN